MDATKPRNKDTDAPLRFRVLDAAEDLALIASSETKGNLSEAIRLSIKEKAERIRAAA
ncbi:MAG: hypothetical protein M3R06_08325 [Chloroflexota bacterium]|nr:hypothetical protein [Chloroflexota bacterium]